MPPVINPETCTVCGKCASICPMDILAVTNSGSGKSIAVLYPEECWHCNACVLDCPVQAVELRHPLSHMLLSVDTLAPAHDHEENI